MDITYVQTFLHIVETGSFAKAAQELQYAPSTVTAHIQALEQELGCALFERIGRKNHLTELGAEFLDYAYQIMHIRQKMSLMGEQTEDSEITLRIGALESLMFCTLLDVAKVFKQSYKKVHLELEIGETHQLREMLRQNKLDLIYITDIVNTDPTLECLHMREEPMVFLTSCRHPLAHKKDVTLSEVLEYPFVAPAPMGNCHNTLRQLAATVGGEIKDSVMVNNIGAISVFLKDDLSVTFLYKSALNKNLHTEDLATVAVQMPAQFSYSQVLVRKNKWLSPALKKLVEIITEAEKNN